MVFSSLTFLCIFFPIVFILHWILPGYTWKNLLLVIASLIFYAYGEPVYVILMLISVVMNYSFGRMLERDRDQKAKVILAFSVITNLGILAVFKYTDWFISTINSVFSAELPLAHIALPIGISFYTFQAMSYVIDVYRKEVPVQKSLMAMFLYISFFPQLIAGPIVRYYDIQEQIYGRKLEIERAALGFRRFTVGLAKKVLISNVMALAADGIFALEISELNILSAWIGGIAYMMQIYFDFSGYSDMAIGMGHMFGFSFLENFNYPYISGTMQEFWRRWHISLSTWFREYLYIPLGGNRKGKLRTMVNKMIVFFATGLWHGANWTFVAWGMLHGCFLMLEEIFPIKKLPKFIRRIYVTMVVCLCFVIFRADTISQGLLFIQQMFIGMNFDYVHMSLAMRWLTPMFVLMAIMAIIGSTPLAKKIASRLEKQTKVFVPLSLIGSLLLLVLCLLNLSGGTYNPFIYFRF